MRTRQSGIHRRCGKAFRHVGVIVAISATMIASGCLWGDDSNENHDEDSISKSLGVDHPCDFLYVSEAREKFFGDAYKEDATEVSEAEFLGCEQYLSLELNGDEVGDLDFTSRVFSNTDPDVRPTGDRQTSKDAIGWFSTESQSDANEVIDSSVVPISESWDDGEMYVLEGLFRNRDLYIVGAWGRVGDLQFGVTFKVTAEQEYFDQPLTYHEYCDVTDLESDCLISSDVLYEWMNSEYLPTVLDRLETASEQ